MYSKYWMHCAHLQVDGKKMSKSLGNFYTLREILEKGFTGREIRYELIGTHYRQGLNFTFASLTANRAALARLDEFYAKVKDAAGSDSATCHSPLATSLPDWAVELEKRFAEALDDDLNIAGGLGALFDGVHEGNKAFPMDSKTALAVSNLWKKLDDVLGFLMPPAAEVPAELIAMAEARVAAKKAKNFAEADRLRAAIASLGWMLQDTPTGPKLKKN
jgi:cysteinyl-tRNA synthetase